jgi:hypothetical protein
MGAGIQVVEWMDLPPVSVRYLGEASFPTSEQVAQWLTEHPLQL